MAKSINGLTVTGNRTKSIPHGKHLLVYACQNVTVSGNFWGGWVFNDETVYSTVNTFEVDSGYAKGVKIKNTGENDLLISVAGIHAADEFATVGPGQTVRYNSGTSIRSFQAKTSSGTATVRASFNGGRR